MPPELGDTEYEHILTTVARLVTAADGDTLYRNAYLRRAADILAPIITEESYESALRSRQQLERLRGRARAAISRQDWEQVRELGRRLAELQRTREAEQVAVAAAESVYGAPPVALDPLSPELIRFPGRWSDPMQARAETGKALAELARIDAANGALYSARQAALDAIRLAGASASASGRPAVSPASVEQEALEALGRGDAAALQRCADAMLGKQSAPVPGEQRPAVAGAAITAPVVLGEPLPEACVARAQALGLEHAATAPVSPEVAAAIGDFFQRYAIGASAATRDRASEGVARLTLAAEGIDVPPDLAAAFVETISLFALHLFVNSAGLRYVPLPTEREVVLVEPHAEGDEAATPLLRELSCGRRRALSRDDIEIMLRKHGARIVGEHLGLDPLAFRLVCIPADLFIRLGRDRGWGSRQEWTHFDGYQIGVGGRLRALVGGNARFGGLADLCSISRGDARENTFVRFAVIRRERLGFRFG
jgi:hypothetical protein